MYKFKKEICETTGYLKITCSIPMEYSIFVKESENIDVESKANYELKKHMDYTLLKYLLKETDCVDGILKDIANNTFGNFNYIKSNVDLYEFIRRIIYSK